MLEIRLQICGYETEIYGDYPHILNMKSVTGHMTLYDVKYNHENNIDAMGISLKPKSDVIVDDYTTYESYDSNGQKQLDKEDIQKLSSNAKFSANSIVVRNTSSTRGILGLNVNASLKDTYERFIFVADNIKSISDGYINQYALYLFNKSLRAKYKTEHIDAPPVDMWTEMGRRSWHGA